LKRHTPEISSGCLTPVSFLLAIHFVHRTNRSDFEGIPTFAPEHFSRVQQVDTMKRKQFVKGMTQIAQEGAIQIFHEPDSGLEEVIVGVVGTLQFDVLQYRLKKRI
jgi:peptide chain release factor 3